MKKQAVLKISGAFLALALIVTAVCLSLIHIYPNIRDLLMGTKSPEEVAAAIDESCNAALDQGRNASN